MYSTAPAEGAEGDMTYSNRPINEEARPLPYGTDGQRQGRGICVIRRILHSGGKFWVI
jgi:hypothetical protein